MRNIKKALYKHLLPAGVKALIYYDEAPQDAVYPYIVYSIQGISSPDESRGLFILDIDAWDRPPGGDPARIENLMAKIDGDGSLVDPTGLNEKIIHEPPVILALRRENRLTIQDKDRRIKRLRYTYSVTVFEETEE